VETSFDNPVALLDGGGAGLCDLVVLQGRGAAHSDRADDLAIHYDRQAALMVGLNTGIPSGIGLE
jgi:hypothetical protein